jgi:hypothetical protein
MRHVLLVILIALAAAGPAAAQGEVTPLFAEDAPLAVTLTGPIGDIVRRADRSTDPVPAKLTAAGETHAIQLSARGVSRRASKNCQFPPLLVRMNEKPAATSLFAKQGRIKLVTHCRRAKDFDRLVLREYAAYRLYNVLTPKSLRVRLARVRYVDDDGKLMDERWGFFIEDIDDAARRFGGKEIDVPGVPAAALAGEEAARYVLFQYMIGNLDWDMSTGPAGEACCHNSKLVGAKAEAREALLPVPYDFDFSGFVNAPYAVSPPEVPVFSVRMRYYRGLCRHNAQVQATLPAFRSARPQLEAVVASVPELTARDRADMVSYLAGFYQDIATDESVQKKLLRTCR